MERWVILEAERVLSVDYGVDTILLDRIGGPVTLVVKLTDEALTKMAKQFYDEQSTPTKRSI